VRIIWKAAVRAIALVEGPEPTGGYAFGIDMIAARTVGHV
jgi:hypothetical protein